MKTRFAVITDAHMGPAPYYGDCNRLMAEESPRVLKKVVDEINREEDISFIIQLGDLVQENVEKPSRDEDLSNLKKALGILGQLERPLYHVVGNHCRATLSIDDLCLSYDIPRLYYSFETAEHTHIVLYAESPGHMDMWIPEEEISWLKDRLSSLRKPAFVYLHHTLAEHPLDDSFWFKGRPDKAFVRNAKEITDLLEQSGKVLGVFNGHMHLPRYVVQNQIPYFTVQSMIEDTKMIGSPCESYTIVTVSDDEIEVDIRGYEPVIYRHKR